MRRRPERGEQRALPGEVAEAVLALGRQALHASRLSFEHPETAALLNFESKLPFGLANLCSILEKWENKLSKN